MSDFYNDSMLCQFNEAYAVFFFFYRLAALLLWKNKAAGTYHDLLKICCAGGDTRTATKISDVVNRKTGKNESKLHNTMYE